MDQIDLTTALDGAPVLIQGLLFAALFMGLALWLLGRKLARPVGAVSGLVLGGLGALIAGRQFGAGQLLLPLTLVGAVVGCLSSWLLYRLWMGLSCALVLALLAPAVSMLWQAGPPPEDQTLDLSGPPPREVAEESWQQFQGLIEQAEIKARAWWKQQGPGAIRIMIISAVAGMIGLLGGLVVPDLSASLLSSLFGTILLFYAACGLIQVYAPTQAAQIPQGPAPILLTLGLITLMGILLQWTVLRHKADNGS